MTVLAAPFEEDRVDTDVEEERILSGLGLGDGNGYGMAAEDFVIGGL